MLISGDRLQLDHILALDNSRRLQGTYRSILLRPKTKPLKFSKFVNV